MDTADVSGVKEKSGKSRSSLADALWLAGHDIRTSWMSYPATIVMAGMFGLLATFQFRNALTGDLGAFGAGLLDFYLLCIISAFGTNIIFNRDYFSTARFEGFDERLSFLKTLPVSTRSIVCGRAICAVLAIVLASPAFFIVPYLLNSSLRDIVGIGGYIGFCFFWVGYAMVFTGLWSVYFSFTVSWRRINMLVYVVAFLAMSIIIPTVFGLISGQSISLTVLGFAAEHSLVVAGVSLLVGAITLAIGVKGGEVGLSRRDIG